MKISMTLCLLGAGLLSAHAETIPSQPSRVYVSGRQLMVQKRLADGTLDQARPYVMKGVNWQPATFAPATGPNPLNPAQSVAYGCFFDFAGRNPQGHIVLEYWLKNEFAAHYQTDIPLMQAMGVNTVRVFSDFGPNAATSNAILDSFYQAGIMVIMTVVSSSNDITNNQYLSSVQQVMNHPAILMWSLGNEWNLNSYYASYPDMNSAIAATQSAALAIKVVDTQHPVSSSLGDIFSVPVSTDPCLNGNPNSDIPTIVANDSAVDLWGLNMYRGSSFGTLFQQWNAVTAKPFFLGEFGVDSFNTTQYSLPFSTSTTCGSNEAQVTAGFEDQATQSAWDLDLWKEIAGQLSAFNAQAPCIGGNIFAFNDEPWEVGDYNVSLGGLGDGRCDSYDAGGFYLPNSEPDNVANEEYYGIVNAARGAKTAYTTLQNYYQALSPLQVPTIQYLNPPSASVGGPGLTLTLNGGNFAADSYVLWSGASRTTSYLGSGRLQITLTAADLAQSANVPIFVVNPSTSGATSALFTFPVESVTNVSAARISPSPWRSDRHSGVPITFDQLAPGSTVKIFTLSGRWVATLAAPAGFVNWDLTNADGNHVASGIYLDLVTDPQGHTSQGRFGIIR